MTTLDRKENLERFQLGSVNIVELSELDRLCVELSHVSVAFFQGMSPE
jgi:DNA-binding Xre family transcriptional regulator